MSPLIEKVSAPLEGASSPILSESPEAPVTSISPPIDPFQDDQFLQASGTFAFDARLKCKNDAEKIADTIWSIVSPLTQKSSCSFDEKIAQFLLMVTADADRETRRKMETRRLIEEQVINLEKKRAESLKQATAQSSLRAEQLKTEQDTLKALEQKIHDEFQQINAKSNQESQTISGLYNTLHEAIMTSMKQM